MNRAKWRDTAQNIVITMLTLTAVLLFSQTQFFHLSSTGGRNYFNPASSGTGSDFSGVEANVLAAPVRVVVSDEFSHKGSITLSVEDEEFLPLQSLLREVLGSSHTPAPCRREEFSAALQRPSILYDFLDTLPLTYIAAHCGIYTAYDFPVRYLLITQREDEMQLFLWDGAAGVLRGTPALQPGSLSFASEQYALENVLISSDLENAQHLSPCVFFPEALPVLNQLSAAVPMQNADVLLSAFEFNPHTNSRYTESSGTEVIMDGDRSLRIQPNGTITYQGGTQSQLQISSPTHSPTIEDAAQGVCTLLSQITSFGDARLYVTSVEQTGAQLQLTLGYEMQGIPICLSHAQYAAVAKLNGNMITDLTFIPRQYTKTEEVSHLLPLTQAMAIVSAQSCNSLYVGYADRNGELIEAAWLTD